MCTVILTDEVFGHDEPLRAHEEMDAANLHMKYTYTCTYIYDKYYVLYICKYILYITGGSLLILWISPSHSTYACHISASQKHTTKHKNQSI